MPRTITGGCLCGHIRFVYDGEPGPAGYCHCTDCRRVTGSAFNVSVPLELARLTLSVGTPKAYKRLADSGNELTRYFCPECGSPLYTASPVHPDTVYVKAGAFDDPDVVKPAIVKWNRSRVAWSVIDPALPAHEKS